jgi:hypothetical protein
VRSWEACFASTEDLFIETGGREDRTGQDVLMLWDQGMLYVGAGAQHLTG